MSDEQKKIILAKMPEKEQTKRGRKAGGFIFPRDSLKTILSIPETIYKQNAGNPFPILDLAPALGMSPTSGTFVRKLSSSYRYGLTEGSPSTKVVSLTPLGRSIVAPTVTDNVNASLRKALIFSEIFKKVYSYFDGKPIPRPEILRNTLTNQSDLGGFSIPREDAEEFIRIWKQNIDDYRLAQEMKTGTTYLRLDKLSVVTATTQITEFGDEEVPVGDEEQHPVDIQEEPKIKPQEERQIPKQIFVAHGKNKNPSNQTVKILSEYGIPHIVATDEANRGRPISVKVAEEMKKCTAGIFIFTADEKTIDADGKEVWRPSDNVVYELGAGSVLYGNKIVIFREEDVDFASDFKELGYITFEKDKLNAKGLDLMKELQSLGIIKFTVT